MQYYNEDITNKQSDLIKYFKSGIYEEGKSIGHCIILWGPDIHEQCELALEIARLLNCKNNGEVDCSCLNCKWIKEQTHPAVKIYTRLDFKEADKQCDDEESSSGKKNINIAQARSIISELAISSDYHRVYILCDRDEEGNLLPLNNINFPEVTSNALLKTFEEPPKNTTFFFLTKDKSDLISTVVSRSQAFFVPSNVPDIKKYDLVSDVIKEYWRIQKNQVLEFEQNLYALMSENDAILILTEIQNYMFKILDSNFENKHLYYRILKDLKFVEDAIRQLSLTPSMNLMTVCENLSFKLILQ